MSSSRTNGLPASRAHLYQEFTERFERARTEKDGLLRYMSQLSGQISQTDRVLAEKERSRAAIAFRRPRTSGSQEHINVLEQEIRSLSVAVRRLEESRDLAGRAIRIAEAEMVAARTKLDEELARLE
ncbi:hypothetical protein HRG_009887 [Hirsutella rhossiliensis]|uniref:Uncharacterized protein n=1 Tax=Hirsutella rhossiliensis TaxID=111463 RepID=A0A9P8MTC8_9HYPO|nr:uncharacterized protein HRG_09887 [Hirsutella rhossiliensis]KAH0958842.1 hypothetical protein HRG_09887 [Hirsutella rhossiliensis]